MRKFFTISMMAIAMSVLLPNCASIVSKSIYPVSINSNPKGATVTITNRSGAEIFNGATPSMVMLKSGAGFFTPARYQVKFKMEGYDDSIITITSSLDGWYFGNILIGGLLGMLIIDPATGAMWRIDEQFINVNLTPNNQQALNILNINDIPEDYKQHLIPIKTDSEN